MTVTGENSRLSDKLVAAEVESDKMFEKLAALFHARVHVESLVCSVLLYLINALEKSLTKSAVD